MAKNIKIITNKDGCLHIVGRRAEVIDDILAHNADGVFHLPTGRRVPYPTGVTVSDDEAFIRHLLAQVPDAWAKTVNLTLGDAIPNELVERLMESIESYKE